MVGIFLFYFILVWTSRVVAETFFLGCGFRDPSNFLMVLVATLHLLGMSGTYHLLPSTSLLPGALEEQEGSTSRRQGMANNFIMAFHYTLHRTCTSQDAHRGAQSQ